MTILDTEQELSHYLGHGGAQQRCLPRSGYTMYPMLPRHEWTQNETGTESSNQFERDGVVCAKLLFAISFILFATASINRYLTYSLVLI